MVENEREKDAPKYDMRKQGQADPQIILNHTGAKNVIVQAVTSELQIQDVKIEKTSKRNNVGSAAVQTKQTEAHVKKGNQHEATLLFRTGRMGTLQTAIDVDLLAYKNRLLVLKKVYKKEGRKIEAHQVKSLVIAFDNHPYLNVSQLMEMHNKFGDMVLPENILQFQQSSWNMNEWLFSQYFFSFLSLYVHFTEYAFAFCW